jgi:hypothetical protein
MQYDQEAELTRYVWDHSQHLMTDFERRVGLAILGRAKAASSSPDMARLLRERWGQAGDPDIDAALADGPEVYRRRVFSPAGRTRRRRASQSVPPLRQDRSHAKRSAMLLVRSRLARPASLTSTPGIGGEATVSTLATAAYEERSLPSGELDSLRLAVLADALEESGCQDAEILGHLRSPGPHVRGCFALDLLLRKE